MAMSVALTNFNGQLVYENRGGVERFYAPDTLGSTAALLDPTGTVTDTFTYWPYGEIQNHVGSSTTPFTFIGTLGYYLDILGNFIYVRARHVRQALTRWQTLDPLWPTAAAFQYANSSPMRYVDPSGLGPVPPLPVKCNSAWRNYINGYFHRCYYGVRILAKADTIGGNKRTGLALQSGHSWRK